MTTITRVRIVPAEDAAAAKEPPPMPMPMASPEQARLVVAVEASARAAASEILARANAEATAIVAKARADAASIVTAVQKEARESEETRLAAHFLQLKRDDETRAERDFHRAVDLGRMLAERLLGTALEQDPTVVVQLAKQALAEARGARRVVIEASPLDTGALQHHLQTTGFDAHTVEVRTDATLERGSLRLVTNLGTLDARLHPQLERLVGVLHDSFEHG